MMALYKTRRGTTQRDYIHLIDADSVKVLIEAVYEPHYEHYSRYFGNTIAGFFSDEPSLGNCQTVGSAGDVSMNNQRLGQPGLALPWTDELLARLNESIGADARGRLAGLWYEQGDGTSEIRLAYMDVLTALWREHFSYQLGEWCRAHGVEYIGHIIEDMNAHARLGCSGGHYFRSLDGQDMAGIDVVLHQIIPGLAHYRHSMIAATGSSDPGFFDYVLARLAASLSHIQPRMKNRAMCEIFGAYGWAEGVHMMKRLMDHMLVRGVNQFVPHAFSPKYPDPDCPPHFNAGGCNPGFAGFVKLMEYTNKAAHLLEGGTEAVSAAILYHAEAEWSGRDYMLTQEPAKRLYDAQMNYDILPIDAIMEQAYAENGVLCVREMRYPALVIPYAECLPAAFLEKLERLEAQGANIAFIDGRPESCSCGEVIPLDKLTDYIRSIGGADVQLKEPFPLLRQAHVKRDGCDVFMVVNESMEKVFEGTLLLPVKGGGVKIDLLGDACYAVESKDGSLPLRLERGASAILLFDADSSKDFLPERSRTDAEQVDGPWTLTLRAAHGMPCDSTPRRIEALYNVTGPQGDDAFSGWMKYDATFETQLSEAVLDLGEVGECARVRLNGKDLGIRIHAPYVFDISKACVKGKNELSVEVTNSLVHQQPDMCSYYLQIPPSGLLGPVRIIGTK